MKIWSWKTQDSLATANELDYNLFKRWYQPFLSLKQLILLLFDPSKIGKIELNFFLHRNFDRIIPNNVSCNMFMPWKFKFFDIINSVLTISVSSEKEVSSVFPTFYESKFWYREHFIESINEAKKINLSRHGDEAMFGIFRFKKSRKNRAYFFLGGNRNFDIVIIL